jgi:glutamyl-tRNA synthetase
MTDAVRVRFAPSPTGPLHLGGARVALFNYLFARRHGGRFILRVEDTDAARSSREFETELVEALKWLGLLWDEGPDIGGPFGPYRQSERRGLYRRATERLVVDGHAYPCFCTEERLEALKARQVAAKLPPRYDGLCRELTLDERRARVAAGEPHVIRFATPRFGEVALDDLIRGRVPVALRNLDDFVIVRSSGDPVFILAGAVDDAAMKVTHALRGEDHLTNTHRQLLLFQALGVEPPRFGHLPLIVGDDGKKLSKRLGDLSVLELREQGYEAEALAAHLARLGWAPPLEANALADMAAAFEVERVARRPARIALADLRRRQAASLRARPAVELAPLVAALAPGPVENLAAKCSLFVDDAHTLRELADHVAALEHPPAPDEAARAILADPAARAALAAFADEAGRAAEWSAESARAAIARAGEAAGVRARDLYQPIRLALQGRLHGPDLPALAAALGREETVRRLQERR